MGRRRKLSEADAEHLRAMYHDGHLRETEGTLAHLFRVSEVTVRAVLGRTGVYKDDSK